MSMPVPNDSLRFLKEENTRLTQEKDDLRQELSALQNSVRALSSLYYLSEKITPGVDVLRLIREILDAALVVLKSTDGSVMLADEETGELVFTVVRGAAAERLQGYRLPHGRGIAGWVAVHRRPQIVRDVRSDPRFYSEIDELFGFNTRSMVCVPIYLDDGRLLGVVEVLNKIGDREFNDEDLALILIVAQLAATAMRRAERALELADREKRRADLMGTRTTP
jgi:GAF domain-containing protein